MEGVKGEVCGVGGRGWRGMGGSGIGGIKPPSFFPLASFSSYIISISE